MPAANAPARSIGTMGSTVNERRIASRQGVSRRRGRRRSKRETTKAAVEGPPSLSQISRSTGAARSAPASTRRSASLRSSRTFMTRLSLEIFQQEPVARVDPCDAAAIEGRGGQGLSGDQRPGGPAGGELLVERIDLVADMVQAGAVPLDEGADMGVV